MLCSKGTSGSGGGGATPDLAQLGLAWQLKSYESKLAHLKEDLEAAEKREAKATGELKEVTAKIRYGSRHFTHALLPFAKAWLGSKKCFYGGPMLIGHSFTDSFIHSFIHL